MLYLPREEQPNGSVFEPNSHKESMPWPNEKLAPNVFDSLIPSETEKMKQVEEFMRNGEWMMLPTAEWTVTRFEGNLAKDRANSVDVSISLWDAIDGMMDEKKEHKFLSDTEIHKMKEKYALLSHGCSGTRLKISFPVNEQEVTETVKQTCQEKYKEAKRVGYFAHGWTGGVETADIPGAEQANLWFRDLEKRGHGSENAVYVRMVSLGMDEANFDPKYKKKLLKEGFGSEDYAHHFSISKEMFGIGDPSAFEELYGHSMGGAMLIYLSRVEELLGIKPKRRLLVPLAPAYDDKEKKGDANTWTNPKFGRGLQEAIASITTYFEKIGAVRTFAQAFSRIGGRRGQEVFSWMASPLVDNKLRALFQAPEPTLQAHALALQTSENLTAKDICVIGGEKQRGDDSLLKIMNGQRAIFITFAGDSLVSPEQSVNEFIDADTPFKPESHLTPILVRLPAKEFLESKKLPGFGGRDEMAQDHYAFQYPEIKVDVDQLTEMMRLEEPLFTFFRLMLESYSRFRMLLPENTAYKEKNRFGDFLTSMFLTNDETFVAELLKSIDSSLSGDQFISRLKEFSLEGKTDFDTTTQLGKILTILNTVGKYTQYLAVKNRDEVIARTVADFKFASGAVVAKHESSESFKKIILQRMKRPILQGETLGRVLDKVGSL